MLIYKKLSIGTLLHTTDLVPINFLITTSVQWRKSDEKSACVGWGGGGGGGGLDS